MAKTIMNTGKNGSYTKPGSLHREEGTLWRDQDGEVNMFVQVGSDEFKMVDLNSGNRYTDPEKDPEKDFTLAEITDGMTRMEGEYEIVKMGKMGCVIAQRLTNSLLGLLGFGISYEDIARMVYKEMLEISLELEDGDWLEMPNGDTFTKTFSVKKMYDTTNRE